jgi:hypothetical protein
MVVWFTAILATTSKPIAHTNGICAKICLSIAFPGFLLIEDFVSLAECERLKERAEQLVEEFEPKDVSVFSTKNQVSEHDLMMSQLLDMQSVACFRPRAGFF